MRRLSAFRANMRAVNGVWRLVSKHRRWVMGGLAVVLLPLSLLNLAIGYFGDTQVFVLSPFHLTSKVSALSKYALHRVVCVFRGDAELGPLIAQAERRHRLPRGLLASVIRNESAMRPHRISYTGAMGPAQLMPGTARMLGVSDPFDPREAVDASARYLASHLDRYGGSMRLAVAAYNAGPGAVRRRVPRNGETEHYVARVMADVARHRAPSRSRKKLAGETRPATSTASVSGKALSKTQPASAPVSARMTNRAGKEVAPSQR